MLVWQSGSAPLIGSWFRNLYVRAISSAFIFLSSMFGFVCFFFFNPLPGKHQPSNRTTTFYLILVLTTQQNGTAQLSLIMGSRAASPIDLDDDVLFIENDWIGREKIYTKVPAFVQWKKDSLMKIPLDFLRHANFPEPELSVKEFVTFKFPRISSEIISNKAAKWFTNNSPSTLDPQILLQHSIPSPAFLTQLEEAVGQAWLDGAKSIVDWRINDGADCLPLWIITFWREAESLNRLQSMWKQSMKWLSHEETRKQRNGQPAIPSDSIQNAKNLLESLQWNERMDYCNTMASTSQLSYFLGTFWLSDDHINMMVEEILLEMHTTRPEDAKYTQVASLFFAQELWSVEDKLALPISGRRKTQLYKYELRVKEDGLQKLYFPIHVDENHWIVGMINFKKKSIAFGKN
jgi:hypothetical protein